MLHSHEQFLAYFQILFGPTRLNGICLFSHLSFLFQSLLLKGLCFRLHLLDHLFLLLLFLFSTIFTPVEEIRLQVAVVHLKDFIFDFCIKSYLVVIGLIFPLFEVAEKDTPEHVFHNCAGFLFALHCHLGLNGPVVFGVLLQRNIHI